MNYSFKLYVYNKGNNSFSSRDTVDLLTAETKHVVMDEPEIISIISNGKNKISNSICIISFAPG